MCVFCYTYFTSNVHLRFTKKAYEKKIETNSQLYLVIFVKMICLIFVKKSEESVFLFWCRVEEFNETFSSVLNVVYSPTRVPN